MKFKLIDMSWKEAEDAFKRSDTVIVPTGTLHAHGPTPIGIDTTAAEYLANEVGKRTGLLTLPVVTYGEDDKMADYPGSIGISPQTLEFYYADILSSLSKNGVRKVVFVNGHGGNLEALQRAGRKARKLGMLVAILEWWKIGEKSMPELYADKTVAIQEMAIALAIHGGDNWDLREEVHKGEWGDNPTRKIFGREINPIMFSEFEYRKGKVVIPMDAWDIDIATPPYMQKNELSSLESNGKEMISKMADYMADFAKEFEKIDVNRFLADTTKKEN
jgi:creatinine amidohydrolase